MQNIIGFMVLIVLVVILTAKYLPMKTILWIRKEKKIDNTIDKSGQPGKPA